MHEEYVEYLDYWLVEVAIKQKDTICRLFGLDCEESRTTNG